MKKFKIALFFLLVIAIAIMIWGNWEFFSAKQSLRINLIKIVYPIPPVANGLLLLGFFITGYLLSTFGGLMRRFQDKKKNDMLKAKVTSQLDKIASLKKELEFLQRNNNRASQEPEQTQTDNTVTQS